MRIKHFGLMSALLMVGTSSASAEPWRRPAQSCGTPQIRSADPGPTLFAAAGQRVIYLNRFGGKYKNAPAVNSATNSASNVVQSGPTVTTFTIAPMSSAFNWPSIRACLEKHWKPFNVRLVESEPTGGAYVEAVIGGTGAEINFGSQSGILGIASTNHFCSVEESGIAFSFAENHIGIPRQDDELCATIAHEVGHVLSLEHEALAPDLMSYVPIGQSQTKAFVSATSKCGVDDQNLNPCSCGTSNSDTNTGVRLTTAVGTRMPEANPPTVTLVTPSKDGKVAPTFEVVVTAADGEGMADVRVFINDREVANSATAVGNKYTIPVTTTEGPHMIKVIARDLAGNETESPSIAFTAAKLAIGETCVGNESCTGNICAMSTDGNFCTQTCQPSADTCPAGFACDSTAMVCVGTSDGGGCCSTSDSNTGPIAALFALGVGVVLLRRRRVVAS